MDIAVIPEKRISVEYILNAKKHSFNPIIVGDDPALIKREKFATSREELNESITAPSRQNFIINTAIVAIHFANELKLENEKVLSAAFRIIEECACQNKIDLVTSKTAQGELLFFTKREGGFNNILIDEDGDISYLRIGKNNSDIKTNFFSNDDALDYAAIVSLL